jgi:hypothetical protein
LVVFAYSLLVLFDQHDMLHAVKHTDCVHVLASTPSCD